MPNDRNNQIVGNAGLFFVCHRLSKMGWNVLPTSRNTRGIDIVAYGSDGSDTITVQVKALSKMNNVSLGKMQDVLRADYFIICLVGPKDSQSYKAPVCFVLTSKEVESAASCKVYEGTRWLQRNAIEQHRDKWLKIKIAEG